MSTSSPTKKQQVNQNYQALKKTLTLEKLIQGGDKIGSFRIYEFQEFLAKLKSVSF